MIDHYSIQLAHLSTSWVVTVLRDITRLTSLESYYRITGGHYLYFEQVGFVTCFVVDGFIWRFESPGKCWMFAVVGLHRILQWTWTGRDLCSAGFKHRSGCTVSADQSWPSLIRLCYLWGWSHSGQSVVPIPTQPLPLIQEELLLLWLVLVASWVCTKCLRAPSLL